jgi:hypothetical protein
MNSVTVSSKSLFVTTSRLPLLPMIGRTVGSRAMNTATEVEFVPAALGQLWRRFGINSRLRIDLAITKEGIAQSPPYNRPNLLSVASLERAVVLLHRFKALPATLAIQTGSAGRAPRFRRGRWVIWPIGICRAPHAVVTIPLQRPRFFPIPTLK